MTNKIDHYAWTSWMWCENEKTVAGDFDDVTKMDRCPECGAEL